MRPRRAQLSRWRRRGTAGAGMSGHTYGETRAAKITPSISSSSRRRGTGGGSGHVVAVSRTNGTSSGMPAGRPAASTFPMPSACASSVSNWASRVASVRSILDLLLSGANPVPRRVRLSGCTAGKHRVRRRPNFSMAARATQVRCAVMAEEPRRRNDREAQKERPSSPTTPLPDRQGDHEHPKGWRVKRAPDGRGMPPQKPPGLRALGPRFIWFVVILLAVNLWISSLIPSTHERIRIPYSPTFLTEVKQGNVKSISSRGTTIQGEFQHEFKYPPTGKGAKVSKLFDTEVPVFANTDQLTAALEAGHVQVNAKPAEQGRSLIANLLIGFGPTLLLVGLFIWFARRAARQGAGGGLMGFGRSGARRVEPSEQHVTFDDVAGIDEAKAELTEIVDFLRKPDKYRRLGGRIPRGVLLSGPPGTGKTLLARAVAGEADVPFFSLSASEFVEAIVGVGASRVRDLFKQAKEAAPAIIFIDELDAIGRSRTAGSSF